MKITVGDTMNIKIPTKKVNVQIKIEMEIKIKTNIKIKRMTVAWLEALALVQTGARVQAAFHLV